ncbi:hypothetical protein CEXT_698111 [Caerostris extrusa]|uniref:Uncharacterized protein n=1 Tax=Caerostris extrusa TaxID=172846 RepID=A0AAV4S2E1_CAEEX|nr:hypothetical protein CEXT_698111 [Caerostris extrusa]
MEGPPAQTFRPNEKGNRGRRGCSPAVNCRSGAYNALFCSGFDSPGIGAQNPLFGRQALQLTGASNGAEIYPLSTFLALFLFGLFRSIFGLYTQRMGRVGIRKIRCIYVYYGIV